MSSLLYLEELSLVGNQLRAVPVDAFSGYHYRRVQQLANDTSDSATDDADTELRLERLVLDKNQISSVTRRDIASFPRLVVLSLSNNNLTTIEDYTFVDVPKLERLSLDHNAIETLSDQSFRGLDALRELGLSHNDLFAIPQATFGGGYGLGRLERLDLSHNRIDSIASRSFDGLHELRELRLDHNGIRWIDADGLATGGAAPQPFVAPGTDTKLTWLYIGHNDLDRLTSPMIAGLRHLKYLDVSDNRINHLDVEAFHKMSRLANLMLQNNRLAQIEDGSFQSLSGLRHLNLAGNKLARLTEDTFRGLDRVEEITLDDNELGALPAVAFNHTPRLATLGVRKNLIRVADLTLADFARRLRHLDLTQNLVSSVVLPEFVTANQSAASAAAVNSSAGHVNAGLLTLSFADNLLESIAEEIVSVMRPPSARGSHHGSGGGGTLRLHGNPWLCDCRLRWLVDAVTRARTGGRVRKTSAMVVDRQAADDLLCKTPSALAGRRVIEPFNALVKTGLYHEHRM
jgi:Leucine-rich repeat (LRR) protein